MLHGEDLHQLGNDHELIQQRHSVVTYAPTLDSICLHEKTEFYST
jgi:hypothetical protein